MEFGCLFCDGIIDSLENQTGVYICLLESIRPHRAVPMQGMYHRLDGKHVGQELWSRMLCHWPWANSRIPIFRCVPARMVGFCPFRARAIFSSSVAIRILDLPYGRPLGFSPTYPQSLLFGFVLFAGIVACSTSLACRATFCLTATPFRQLLFSSNSFFSANFSSRLRVDRGK